jgi:hypothetical protein
VRLFPFYTFYTIIFIRFGLLQISGRVSGCSQ